MDKAGPIVCEVRFAPMMSGTATRTPSVVCTHGQAKGEMTAIFRRSGSVPSLVNLDCPSQIDSRTGLWLGERRGDRIYGTHGAVLDVATNVACNIRDRLHDKEIT
jgi:hypothetical protein